MLSVPTSAMRPDDISNGDFYKSTSRSRSRSVPPSFKNNNRSHSYHEAHGDLKMVVHNEPVHRINNKGVKGNFTHREDSQMKSSRHMKRCNDCSTPEFDDYLPERHCVQRPGVQESPVNSNTVNSAIVIEQNVGSSNSLVSQEQWSGNTCGIGSIQLSRPEPESSEGSKEVDQIGQIPTMLEVSPTDDVS